MLMALPVPVTSYSTDSVAPGLADSLGGVALGGGATTVSCFELLAPTSAITRPTTRHTATAAATHSHRGDLGLSGPSGGSPGGYGWPYCPVPYWPVVYWPVAYWS